jgi:CO/xanthine dehydrogenase FAD-binding subunit
MPLSEFLIKPYKTQIARGELVTAFVLKIPAENYRGRFVKVGRRSGVAISRITLATLLDCHDGIIRDIRIASGAITPIGLRFFELEDMLRGKPVSIDLAKTTALKLGKLIHEKTGVRWSTPYKLPVVQQICYQQLHELFEAKE